MHITNGIYKGAEGKESLYDLEIPQDWNHSVVIFMHGYMGYKDWGAWHLVQNYFIKHGYGFVKYNVSHNGGTTQNPIDFDDLEAFSNNSYTKEIQDFEAIISMVESLDASVENICIIGHSRGGGVALLQSENPSISKIASWAAIASIAKRFPTGEALEAWRTSGTRTITNGRTKQVMPHAFAQYEDFKAHKERLNIEAYCRNSTTPTLVIHGSNDTSVLPEEAEHIAHWLNIAPVIIQNTQHTFDTKQPWTESEMPEALEDVCARTLNFFNGKQSK